MLSFIHGGLMYATEATPRGAYAPVVVMDNQGRVIKTLTPELSKGAMAAKAADAERALATTKADEDQKRKDRILFDSYTTEAEIDLARDRAASVLEAQMEIGRAYANMLAKRRSELVKRKADGGNKPLPPSNPASDRRCAAQLHNSRRSLKPARAVCDRSRAALR